MFSGFSLPYCKRGHGSLTHRVLRAAVQAPAPAGVVSGAGRDLEGMQTVQVVMAFIKTTSACIFMVLSSSKLELFSLTSC